MTAGRPIHPGEILREQFMAEMGPATAGALARALGVARSRIEGLVRGQRSITADTALRLGRLYRTTPQFWMNLQVSYDLRRAESEIGGALKEIEPAG